jgi:hypothetical protein
LLWVTPTILPFQNYQDFFMMQPCKYKMKQNS